MTQLCEKLVKVTHLLHAVQCTVDAGFGSGFGKALYGSIFVPKKGLSKLIRSSHDGKRIASRYRYPVMVLSGIIIVYYIVRGDRLSIDTRP